MRPSKRDELVSKALEIFYRHGFQATGMDMLVAETGISKTSMYKYFRTKEDLILAAMRLRDEQFRNWLIRRMEEHADTPQGQLLAMFDTLEEWFDDDDFRNCMFIKASCEYQEPGHAIYNMAAEHKRLVLAHLETLARKSGAKDPQQLADQLSLLAEGATITAHMLGRNNAAHPAKQAAEVLIASATGKS